MKAFCTTCNKHGRPDKQEMTNVQYVVMKNGRHAATGTCGTCSGKMYQIVKASDVPA